MLSESFWPDLALYGEADPAWVRRLLPTDSGEDSSTGKNDSPDSKGSVSPCLFLLHLTLCLNSFSFSSMEISSGP